MNFKTESSKACHVFLSAIFLEELLMNEGWGYDIVIMPNPSFFGSIFL